MQTNRSEGNRDLVWARQEAWFKSKDASWILRGMWLPLFVQALPLMASGLLGQVARGVLLASGTYALYSIVTYILWRTSKKTIDRPILPILFASAFNVISLMIVSISMLSTALIGSSSLGYRREVITTAILAVYSLEAVIVLAIAPGIAARALNRPPGLAEAIDLRFVAKVQSALVGAGVLFAMAVSRTSYAALVGIGIAMFVALLLLPLWLIGLHQLAGMASHVRSLRRSGQW